MGKWVELYTCLNSWRHLSGTSRDSNLRPSGLALVRVYFCIFVQMSNRALHAPAKAERETEVCLPLCTHAPYEWRGKEWCVCELSRLNVRCLFYGGLQVLLNSRATGNLTEPMQIWKNISPPLRRWDEITWDDRNHHRKRLRTRRRRWRCFCQFEKLWFTELPRLPSSKPPAMFVWKIFDEEACSTWWSEFVNVYLRDKILVEMIFCIWLHTPRQILRFYVRIHFMVSVTISYVKI